MGSSLKTTIDWINCAKFMAILAEMADSWEFLGIFGNFMGIIMGVF